MEYIRIKVTPKSNSNSLTGCVEESTEFGPQLTFKVKIKAAPEKGKANKCLIEFLSEILEIKKQDITIISGQTSQLKLLKINIPDAIEKLQSYESKKASRAKFSH